MGKITELKQSKRSKKRVNVYIDGRFSLSLNTEEVLRNKLKVGMELTAEKQAELTGNDIVGKATDIAVRYLGYRPRSESEIRTKLLSRGCSEEITDTVISKLKEQKLIDDIAFANFWKDNRDTFSPRSSWLTRLELKRKGVSDEIADQVINSDSEYINAYEAAQTKARRLNTKDYAIFRQRLGEYLKRRGFGYEVINKTIVKVWQEYQEHSPA
ncbi:MAG: RecX family transcriptional regulator [Dehalococcoidales bacterium]|nr:RecX family transcriptional regulator [Dehalococcoidales bacterium]